MPRPCRVGAERDHSQMRIAPCRRGRPYVSSARTGTEFRRIVHGQPRRGDPRHDQETAGLSAFGDFGSVGTMRLGRLAMDAAAPFEPSAPRLVFEASTMRWRRRKRARRSSMGADRPGASPPRSAPFRPGAGERGVGRRLRLIGEPRPQYVHDLRNLCLQSLLRPFTNSRTSTVRLRPPCLAGGISASICAHSSPVRSLGWRSLSRLSLGRFAVVHIGGPSSKNVWPAPSAITNDSADLTSLRTDT